MEIKEQLPGFVLADLFGKSLVSTDEKQLIKKAVVPESAKWYLGNYSKKIIVLINDENNVYLSDDDLSFLGSILSACKLNPSQIALINFYNKAIDFLQLKHELQPEFLIAFGVNPLQIELPFTMPFYQVQQYDKCQIVTAPSLNELNQQTQQSKNKKAKLWKSLQKMFCLEK